MTLKFDLEIFGKCLQGLGQGMMQGGMLMSTTRMIHRGGLYGGMSIWGCGSFMGCPPPLNIWHPMYADNTTNPYLIQQGNNYASLQAQELFDKAYEYYKKQEQQFGPQFPPTESEQTTQTEIGKEIQNALINVNGEASITTSQYSTLFNKENKTEEEKELLDKAYKESIKSAGESYINFADKTYGNADGSMTTDEFTEYLMGTITRDTGYELTEEGKEVLPKAFNKLDLNGDNKISKDEMSALLGYIDISADNQKDGKLTNTGFFSALQGFESEDTFKDTLKDIHDDLYSE